MGVSGLAFGEANPQWQIELARTLHPRLGYEVRLLLPSSFCYFTQQQQECFADIHVSIAVRSAAMQVVYADERLETLRYALQQANPETFFLCFWLPIVLDSKTIDVFIEDPLTHQQIFWQEEYLLPKEEVVETGLPLFTNVETGQVILQKFFPTDIRTLQIGVTAQSAYKRPVVLQQTLLRREHTANNPDAVAYIPVESATRAIRFVPTKQRFLQQIDLEHLEAGEYLVQWVWFADEQVLGESSKSFILPWKGINQVFENLDTSIEQLLYRATPAEIHSLRNISDEDLKRREFIHFWENQPDYHEPVYLKIGNYYQKIKLAQEKFSSWSNDQSRIFLQLGFPHKIRYVDKYLFWYYPELNLTVPFQRKAGQWKVVFT